MPAPTTGPDTVEAEVHAPSGAPRKRRKSKKDQSIVGKSPLQIAWGRLRRDKIAVVCGLTVLLFLVMAVFAGTISKIFGVDLEPVFASSRVGLDGLPLKGPPNFGFDPAHPLGVAPRTGEDNLALFLYGCRTSLIIAGSATLIASLVGIVLGLIGGFLGGAVDKGVSFLTDFFLTIPFLLAALTLAPIINDRFSLSDNYFTIQRYALIAILAGFGWMGLARLIRGEVLSLREREFIMAARVLGMPTHRVLIKELLPNLVAPIVISISLMLPLFVAAEAGLALLGIGVTKGASWGQTINKGVTYFDTYPQYLWIPLLGIVALVLSLNLLGDAIRDALDPKTRR